MLKNSFYDVKIGHRLFPESLRRKTKKDAETGLRTLIGEMNSHQIAVGKPVLLLRIGPWSQCHKTFLA